MDHQSRERIEWAFAQSMFAKATALREATLTKRERARLKEAIAGDVRKASDILSTILVSEAAHAEAAKLGVDLRELAWHDQPKFDGGRKVFHFEHVEPVGTWIDAVCEQTSVDGVLAVLKRGFRVAWILKVEDRELTRLGFRHTRPNPDIAYQSAGIQLRSIA
jgi:hypothetical protein